LTNLPAENNLLGIVGPCSAGKTTLIDKLEKLGYACRHIAQEHSYVPEMWLKIVNPRVLIYLDVGYETSIQRRYLNLASQDFDEQVKRLAHARKNAHIYVDTESLSPDEVYQEVINSLKRLSVDP
jgi:broad-specificity NMP kinase